MNSKFYHGSRPIRPSAVISDFLLENHRQYKLKAYFQLIWEKEEILQEIGRSEQLSRQFFVWNTFRQEEFLDACTGVKGVKMLYDIFFKEVMDSETAPEHLKEFLSLILGFEVRILYVLANESPRPTDENTLLVMDIVVQLADGSVANVEVQKQGYRFPGERSACYSADLLLRQYRRIRGEENENFSYKRFYRRLQWRSLI